MVERIVSGAHYGLRDWLMQPRHSRRYGALLALYGGLPAYHQPLQFTDWSNLFHNQWMRLASLLFLLSLYLHAWVGVRDILNGLCAPHRAQVDGRGVGHTRLGRAAPHGRCKFSGDSNNANRQAHF